MDIFKALTGGGARFDKRFANDIKLFQPSQPVASTSTALPDELNFFATPAPSDPAAERAAAKKSKKRKRAEEAAAEAQVAGIDYPAFLRSHKIKFTGLEPPNPVTSLTDLSLRVPPLLLENWHKMGLLAPTAIQMASWGVMMEKRDLLACAPTGSGKTLAFLLPLLALNPPAATSDPTPRPRVVILEPTRELAMQVCREAKRLGDSGGWEIKVLGENGQKVVKKAHGKRKRDKPAAKDASASGPTEDGGEETEAPQASTEPTTALEGPMDVLITTPLRLVFAIESGAVDVSNLRHLILDEADKLFELNFVEQTDDILAACASPDLRKAMFSATMPSGVEEMAKSVMSGAGVGLIRAIVGHKDAATETIAQSLQFVGAEDHKLLSLRSIIQEGSFTPPVLIFVQSILRAKELSTELLLDGVNADCIHADRTKEERDEVVKSFAEGKVWCLIATDVFSRGVDFKGVKLVINYDFPQSGGSYIHRIGRTGRAGKEGRAITFFTKGDALHLKSIVNVMRASGCDVPQWMLDLKNPSKDDKKRLLLRPISRKDVSKTNGAGSGAKSDRKRVEKTRPTSRTNQSFQLQLFKMSDDGFMMDEADEDYEFEYEEDAEEEGGDAVDVENEYYTAKSQRDTPDIALASFQKIVQNEADAGEQGDFGFKSLKQMIKLTFKLGRYDEALRHYKTLLTYTKTGVTRNVAEKSINGILDYVSAESSLETGRMQEFYEVTMKALEDAKNDRLSTKTNLKLAKLWLDRKEYTRLNKILKELHAACAPDEDGEVDSSKGTLQLEVYALEIQMYGETKNNKKLREIYEKSSRVRSAIPHPRIQGVLRECGGKMYMSEKDWAKAQVDFFESFKSYDEAGSPQRIQVLKYLVLAHMLMDSQINPFDSQETKPYKNDREIVAMTNLVSAYQRRDVHEAEKILRDNRATIMDDPFIRGYIDDVLRSLRTQWILEIIKPYTRIEIIYLARQLKIPPTEVEDILVALILDDKIQGRIDQVSQRLELDQHKALETRRYASLDKWTTQLTSLQGVMLQKSAGAGGPDRSASLGLPGMGSSSNWMGMGGMGLGASDVWA